MLFVPERRRSRRRPSAIRAKRAAASGAIKIQNQVIGLRRRPLSHTIRWRWQPVENPVVPT